MFINDIVWLIRSTTRDRKRSITWRFTSLLEDYADDLALLTSYHQDIPDKSNKTNQSATYVGLSVNINKAKVKRINNGDANKRRRWIGHTRKKDSNNNTYHQPGHLKVNRKVENQTSWRKTVESERTLLSSLTHQLIKVRRG